MSTRKFCGCIIAPICCILSMYIGYFINTAFLEYKYGYHDENLSSGSIDYRVEIQKTGSELYSVKIHASHIKRGAWTVLYCDRAAPKNVRHTAQQMHLSQEYDTTINQVSKQTVICIYLTQVIPGNSIDEYISNAPPQFIYEEHIAHVLFNSGQQWIHTCTIDLFEHI